MMLAFVRAIGRSGPVHVRRIAVLVIVWRRESGKAACQEDMAKFEAPCVAAQRLRRLQGYFWNMTRRHESERTSGGGRKRHGILFTCPSRGHSVSGDFPMVLCDRHDSPQSVLRPRMTRDQKSRREGLAFQPKPKMTNDEHVARGGLAAEISLRRACAFSAVE